GNDSSRGRVAFGFRLGLQGEPELLPRVVVVRAHHQSTALEDLGPSPRVGTDRRRRLESPARPQTALRRDNRGRFMLCIKTRPGPVMRVMKSPSAPNRTLRQPPTPTMS